jgi:hypothetical protein
LGLEKIAASLAEQTPAKVDRTLQQQKERYQHLGMAALGVFALGLLVFISYSIGYKLMLSQGNILTAFAIIGFIIMAACGLTSVVLFAKAKELGEGASKRPRQENLASDESTRELLSEGNFEPVSSITDRATDLLTVERRKKSTEL